MKGEMVMENINGGVCKFSFMVDSNSNIFRQLFRKYSLFYLYLFKLEYQANLELVKREKLLKRDLSAGHQINSNHLADSSQDDLFPSIRAVNNKREEVNKIRAAMERIKPGKFGLCVDCGIDITMFRVARSGNMAIETCEPCCRARH